MRKINDINDLREDLLDVYNELREGKIGIREVKERANLSGKIMGSAKLEMEYNVYTKSSKRIPFMEHEYIKDVSKLPTQILGLDKK